MKPAVKQDIINISMLAKFKFVCCIGPLSFQKFRNVVNTFLDVIDWFSIYRV